MVDMTTSKYLHSMILVLFLSISIGNGQDARTIPPPTTPVLGQSFAPTVVWQQQLGTHAASGLDFPTNAIVDDSGNSYITGYVSGLGTNLDFLTIKVDTAGQIVWKSVQDGPLHYRDEPTGITLDRKGNILVSGLQNGLNGTLELTTVKINQSGSTQWVKRFPYNGGNFDPTIVAADETDNVVTAVRKFDGSTGWYSAVVVKYSTNGTQLWQRLVDSCNQIENILFDRSGNIFLVCQFGLPQALGRVVKLDPEGVVQWTKSVGPRLLDAAISWRSGLVFVGATKGISPDSKCIIGEIDSSGEVIWQEIDDTHVSSYSVAIAGTKDKGYVVSAVTVEGGSKHIVFRYDSVGQRLWSLPLKMFYTSVFSRSHISESPSGSIGVTIGMDYTFGLMRISASGVLIGSANVLGGTILAGGYDRLDRMFAAGMYYEDGTGNQNMDYGVTRFAQNGAIDKRFRYEDHTVTDDGGTALIVDSVNNCYVAGSSLIDARRKPTVWKLRKDGSIIWRYTSTQWSMEEVECRSMSMDGQGNIVLLNNSIHEQDGQSVIVSKLDSEGTLRWEKKLPSLSILASGTPLKFGCNRDGSIVFTTSQLTTVKMDSSGNILWMRTPTDISPSQKTHHTLIGLNGSSYVSCVSIGSDNYENVTLMKYDSEGNRDWVRFMSANNANHEDVTEMIFGDSSSIITIGGKFGGRGSSLFPYDFFLTSTTSMGTERWLKTVDSTVSDYSNDVCIDNEGNIVIVGTVIRPGIGADMAVLKIDQQGNSLWGFAPIQYPALVNNEPVSVCTDPENNIYVLGGNKQYYHITCLSPSGAVLGAWLNRSDIYGVQVPRVIKHSQKSTLHALVTVAQGANLLASRYAFIRLIKLNVGDLTTVKDRPKFSLVPQSIELKNWPNPFNPITKMSYSIPTASRVQLSIVNVIGQTVSVLRDEEHEAGTYDALWNGTGYPSGIYYGILATSHGKRVVKLCLIK